MPDDATPGRPLSVAALSQRIAGALGDLGTVLVQGELSQAKVHTSGHFYATLKDSEAIISVVMWRSTVVRNGPLPKEGSLVTVRGSVSVYAPRGQYQLTATKIAPLGAGDLAARLEALKARLLAEGLFAAERKRALPFLPRAVGLATAAGSAALADLLHSIRARFPRMPVVHAPCAVQGPDAPAQIVAALARLAAHPEVDVIVCGRGGGSLEDLWAFNDERVVRAIAACAKPVISAVGHETDTTLADLAADLRAKTPTAAGELVVPDARELAKRLDDGAIALERAMQGLMQAWNERLDAIAAHRALAGPGYQVELRRQRLDELTARLDQAIDRSVAAAGDRLREGRARLAIQHPARRVGALVAQLAGEGRRLLRAAGVRRERGEARFIALAAKLDALSPLAVIARGFSMVRTPDGHVVRSLAEAPPGSRIEARLADGWLLAQVDGTRPQRLNEAADLYSAQ